MKDIFFFDSMLTPKIIVVLYWIMLLSVVLSGLGLMFAGHAFFRGLLAILFGAVGVRIFCELLIVMFKMNEALQELRSR